MPVFSAIATWFTTKFFLGRKIDGLRKDNSSLQGKLDGLKADNLSFQNKLENQEDKLKSQNEIDSLLWLKEVFRSSNPSDRERIFTVIFKKRYPYIFPLEVLMSGSETEKRIDDFLFFIRMYGYKKAERMMSEKYK